MLLILYALLQNSGILVVSKETKNYDLTSISVEYPDRYFNMSTCFVRPSF